jgi:hypothetical protein
VEFELSGGTELYQCSGSGLKRQVSDREMSFGLNTNGAVDSAVSFVATSRH